MTASDAARATPETLWASLDDGWRAAFEQAWAALRAGSIPVGAAIATHDGRLVHAARNRIHEADGPHGEVWGTTLAHAEINVLARVPYHGGGELVLTTTLEPCLQCAAAIRLAGIAAVRFAGSDRYWEGAHDFARLSAREAGRAQPQRHGPRDDELGTFASLIALLGPSPGEAYLRWLREAGEGATVDVAVHLRGSGNLARLAGSRVEQALAQLWPDLQRLHEDRA